MITAQYYLYNPLKYTKEEEDELILLVKDFLRKRELSGKAEDYEKVNIVGLGEVIIDRKKSNDAVRNMVSLYAKVLIVHNERKNNWGRK